MTNKYHGIYVFPCFVTLSSKHKTPNVKDTICKKMSFVHDKYCPFNYYCD